MFPFKVILMKSDHKMLNTVFYFETFLGIMDSIILCLVLKVANILKLHLYEIRNFQNWHALHENIGQMMNDIS